MMDDKLSKLERELRADPYDWNKRKALAEQYRRNEDYLSANLTLLTPECADYINSQPIPADNEFEWIEPEKEGWERHRNIRLANVPCEIWFEGYRNGPRQVFDVSIPIELPLMTSLDRLKILQGMQGLLEKYFMVDSGEEMDDDREHIFYGLQFLKSIDPEDESTYLANPEKVVKYFRDNLHPLE